MAKSAATRRQNLAQIARARRQVEQARGRPSLPSRAGRRPTPNPGLQQRLRGKRGKPDTSSGPRAALTSAIAKAGSTAAKQSSRRPGKKPVAGGLVAGVGLGAAALLKRRRAQQDEATPEPVVVEPSPTSATSPATPSVVVADPAAEHE